MKPQKSSKKTADIASGARALSYHERVKAEKRQAAMGAAMEVFLEHGFAGASLQQIARRAGLSTATIFKRFPTKASLFEAIIPEFWAIAAEDRGLVHPGDPWAGLRTIGLEFAAICQHPRMLGLYRVFILEAAQFPELGKFMLARGKFPYVNRIKDYLDSETVAGNLKTWDNATAAAQFLGMITDHLFWPVLLAPGYSVTSEDAEHTVEEAVLTVMARYGQPPR